MSALTSLVTCTYNGIDLSGPEFQTLGISSRNIEDAAGRTVTHQVVSLKIKTYVIEGATQDATMAAIRTALERPGGQLVYSGTAFGGLTINTAAGNRDLVWGPKPRVLGWKPVGGDRAAEIVWEVEVALLNCDGAVTSGKVMEAVYSLTLSTDVGGYYTRTHTGFIRIPMTRVAVANGRIPDTADNYFDDWVPAKPTACDRIVSRTLDESKSKLTFTIVDTQRRGNPLPAGFVNAAASHVMNSTGKYVHVSWTGTLTASYESEAGRPRSDAFETFIKLAQDRILQERQRGAVFIPLAMSIGEPAIYDRESASLSLHYALNYTSSTRRFPTAGLWRPPIDTWQRWDDSLKDRGQHHRGISNIRHRESEDSIVDLCLPAGTIVGRPIATAVGQSRIVVPDWDEVRRRLQIDDKPPADATWLLYENRLVIEPIDHVVPHVPLPKEKVKESRLVSVSLNRFVHTGPGYTLSRQETPAPIVQRRATSSYYIRMIGRAVRWRYEIPRPMLARAARSKVFEANHPDVGTFWSHWIASWTAHPIYAAMWNLRWFVARPDGAVSAEVPDMPMPWQMKNLDNDEL